MRIILAKGGRNGSQFDVLRDIYLWSMDTTDLKYLVNDPWISFLAGTNPGYPEKAIKLEMKYIARCIEGMSADDMKQDIYQTDDMQKLNPVKAGTLVQLTTGGNDPGIAGNILHCRVRYFDPILKRVGLPDDVAALVEKITSEGIELILVNTNPVQSRKIILQAGAYGEHQFRTVEWNNQRMAVNNKNVIIELAPGSGSKFILKMNLYANTPNLTFPW